MTVQIGQILDKDELEGIRTLNSTDDSYFCHFEHQRERLCNRDSNVEKKNLKITSN